MSVEIHETLSNYAIGVLYFYDLLQVKIIPKYNLQKIAIISHNSYNYLAPFTMLDMEFVSNYFIDLEKTN